MDKATVHVESFPKEMTPESMIKVFQRAGVIRHIRLPKLPDGQLKGFCFIEFATETEANKACEVFNNCVPEEFTNNSNANYVQRKEAKVNPLRVISKLEWLEHKKDLAKIRKEIAALKPKPEIKVDF
jgi:RNA recognition motif-containing protein